MQLRENLEKYVKTQYRKTQRKWFSIGISDNAGCTKKTTTVITKEKIFGLKSLKHV